MLGKLDTGDWPVVGESGAEALAKSAELDNLNKQREALEEALAEVDQKIIELDLPAEEAAEPEEATEPLDATAENAETLETVPAE